MLKKLNAGRGIDVKASFADFSQKEEYKDFLNTLALKAEVDFQEDGCQMKFSFACLS